MDAWFADARGGPPPPHRAPWAQPGWFDAAVAWIQAQMERQGMIATGPVEQHRSLTISCLLRVKTISGDLFMKASPLAMFGVEATLTQALAERYPGHIPTLLATDPGRNWILMRDFGGGLLGKCPQIARWEEVVRVYARMQRDFVEPAESLTAMGCRDRRLDRLKAGIGPLLAHVESESEQPPEGLAKAEVERLHALVPRLRGMCDELAEYRVPATLEHGDLHAGNVAVTDEICLLYDWSDGCLSHPFFSMVTLLNDARGITDCPDAGARLRDLYLEAWTEFEPMERLRQAFDLSQLLARLHQAQSYHWISAHLEESALWEWRWGASSWLRGLLKRIDEPR
jgi:Phosphotransferase enzyme family